MMDPRAPQSAHVTISHTTPTPRVLSVNVGAVREVEWRGKQVRTGIWKEPVIGRSVSLRGVNLEGDDQADRSVHGGLDVGTTVIEVAQPRLPCFKLGIRMDDAHFPKRFLSVGRLGAYFRIVQEGEVRADDVVIVIFRPDHAVTLGLMAAALEDRGKAAALLAAPRLPDFWRRIATGRADQ